MNNSPSRAWFPLRVGLVWALAGLMMAAYAASLEIAAARAGQSTYLSALITVAALAGPPWAVAWGLVARQSRTAGLIGAGLGLGAALVFALLETRGADVAGVAVGLCGLVIGLGSLHAARLLRTAPVAHVNEQELAVPRRVVAADRALERFIGLSLISVARITNPGLPVVVLFLGGMYGTVFVSGLICSSLGGSPTDPGTNVVIFIAAFLVPFTLLGATYAWVRRRHPGWVAWPYRQPRSH